MMIAMMTRALVDVVRKAVVIHKRMMTVTVSLTSVNIVTRAAIVEMRRTVTHAETIGTMRGSIAGGECAETVSVTIEGHGLYQMRKSPPRLSRPHRLTW
jgi:hypothetical protein